LSSTGGRSLLRLAWSVPALGSLVGGAHPAAAQPIEPPRVVPVMVLPGDYPYDARRLPFNLTAVDDVRAWYGRALAGVTFVAEPLVGRWRRRTFAETLDGAGRRVIFHID